MTMIITPVASPPKKVAADSDAETANLLTTSSSLLYSKFTQALAVTALSCGGH